VETPTEEAYYLDSVRGNGKIKKSHGKEDYHGFSVFFLFSVVKLRLLEKCAFALVLRYALG
jgi:hypothetical protein